MNKPNILFIMTDQQRFDTIRALGNSKIVTPNMDRLVKRGVSFTNAYSPCPVCVPARYTIRTGCDSPTTLTFRNSFIKPPQGMSDQMEERCGPYLAKVLRERGYRTFGIGKFHTSPWDEDLGFDVHLHSEELYDDSDQRARDAYAKFIKEKHPSYDFIETLMGERTEMYYMPQMSPLPADLTVENWAAERVVEQLAVNDDRPYFGFVSFIGPHPPLAPPIPYNRVYHPDQMDTPLATDIEVDMMDEQISYMNQMIWAEETSNLQVRILKARYYGEISYIDECLGKILDAVEKRHDADNTAIVFFADHGDNFGDHHAWQKETFFDTCMKIPFLVSWPQQLPPNEKRDELTGLTDLFAIATHISGDTIIREGKDLIGVIQGTATPREYLFGYYENPGSAYFKMMVRDQTYKYNYFCNGGKEQLFHMKEDPHETVNIAKDHPELCQKMKRILEEECQKKPALHIALENHQLKAFPFTKRPKGRFYQFDRSRNVFGFPEDPEKFIKEYQEAKKST